MVADCVTWMRQFVCGLHGHDELLQFGDGRLSLKCASCGHDSPGWEIKKHEPPEAPSGVPEPGPRRRLLPHFAGARRLA
jgi:hypothetical protein